MYWDALSSLIITKSNILSSGSYTPVNVGADVYLPYKRLLSLTEVLSLNL